MLTQEDEKISLFDCLNTLSDAIEAKNKDLASQQISLLAAFPLNNWQSECVDMLLAMLEDYINYFIIAKDNAYEELLNLETGTLRNIVLQKSASDITVSQQYQYILLFTNYYLRFNDHKQALTLLSFTWFTDETPQQKIDPAILEKFSQIEGLFRLNTFNELLQATPIDKRIELLLTKSDSIHHIGALLGSSYYNELSKCIGPYREQLLAYINSQLKRSAHQSDSMEEHANMLTSFELILAVCEAVGFAKEALQYYDNAIVYTQLLMNRLQLPNDEQLELLTVEKLRLSEVTLDMQAPRNINSATSTWQLYRKTLSDWRNKLKQSLPVNSEPLHTAEIKVLQKENNAFLQAFVRTLFHDGELNAGPSPEGLEYSVLGLDSLAFNLALPFSPIETAILINEKNELNLNYLKRVLAWIKLSVLSLGENNWISGFNLNRVLAGELGSTIQTIEESLTLIKGGEAYNDGLEFVTEIVDKYNTVLLFGSDDLHRSYQETMDTQLDVALSKNESSFISLTYRENCSLRGLKSIYYHFLSYLNLNLDEINLERLSHSVFYALKTLALYWKKRTHEFDDVCQFIVDKGFDIGLAYYLLEGFYRVQGLRYMIHLKNGQACETANDDIITSWLFLERGLADFNYYSGPWTIAKKFESNNLLKETQNDCLKLFIPSQLFLRFYEQLPGLFRKLNWLEEIPRQGRTEAVLDHNAYWSKTLECVQPTLEAESTVKLTLLTLVENEEKYQPKLVSCRLPSKFFLNDLDGENQAWRTVKDYDHANHVVFRLKHQTLDAHVKLRPELPGLEMACYWLKALLTNEVLPVSIGKVEKEGDNLLPEVVTISTTLTYQNAADALSDKLFSEESLDDYYFSLYTVLAGLINPLDAKPNNHIFVPLFNENGDLRYAFVDVDNEQAFQEALVKSKEGLEVNAKSIYFCFQKLRQPLHPAVVKLLLSIDPYQLLKHWLNILLAVDEGINKLFSEKDIKHYFERQGLAKTTLAILLEKETVCYLWEKLNRLQELLHQAKQEIPTHLVVLNRLEPAMKGRYEQHLNKSFSSPGDRFFDLTGHAYSKVLGYHARSNVNLNAMSSAGLLLNIPTWEQIRLRQLYSPHAVLGFFDSALADYDNKVALCRDELLQGKFTIWDTQFSPYFRELVINKLDFVAFSKLPSKTQNAFKERLFDTAFRELNLSNWQHLTDSDIERLLVKSWQLTRLEAKNCPKLSSEVFFYLLKIEQTLETVDLSGCSPLKKIKHGWKTKLHFSKLRRLSLNDCVNLQCLHMSTPQLTELWLANCSALGSIETNSPVLRTVDLSYNQSITLAALQNVSKTSPLLRTLNVQDSPLIPHQQFIYEFPYALLISLTHITVGRAEAYTVSIRNALEIMNLYGKRIDDSIYPEMAAGILSAIRKLEGTIARVYSCVVTLPELKDNLFNVIGTSQSLEKNVFEERNLAVEEIDASDNNILSSLMVKVQDHDMNERILAVYQLLKICCIDSPHFTKMLLDVLTPSAEQQALLFQDRGEKAEKPLARVVSKEKKILLKNASHFSLLCAQGKYKDILSQLAPLNQVDRRKLICTPDSQGEYPLHHAAKQGHLKIISLLVQWVQRDDLLAMTNVDGYLPIYSALSCLESVCIPVVENFLTHGIPLSIRTSPTYDRRGNEIPSTQRSLLHSAAHYGNLHAMKFLIDLMLKNKLKAMLDSPEDLTGYTPLHTAVVRKQPEIVKILLTSGANPAATDMDRKTPLMLAIYNEHIECAIEFLKQGLWLTEDEINLLYSKHENERDRLSRQIDLLQQSQHMQAVQNKVKEKESSFNVADLGDSLSKALQKRPLVESDSSDEEEEKLVRKIPHNRR